jgi:predicted nuclease with TOPRIM domain
LRDKENLTRTRSLDLRPVDDEVRQSNELDRLRKEICELQEKYKEAADKSKELQLQKEEMAKDVLNLKAENRRLQRKFDRINEELQNRKALDRTTKLRQLKELSEQQLAQLSRISVDIRALLSHQTSASAIDSDTSGTFSVF